jgi:hypothetical protein
MGKHETPETTTSLARRATRHALHPIVHLLTLVTLHVVALGVIEKTPLLTLLFVH